jgi:nucleoside-triphosphatase THEP1
MEIIKLNVISIIQEHTIADDENMKSRFIQHIKHLYQYAIFKDLLDLVATKASQNSLKFNIKEKKQFDLDEGNCKTINAPLIDSVLNRFRENKHYVITIKKIEYNVIIHEIAHMVEQELNLDLSNFVKFLHCDFQNDNNSITVKNAINEILIKQVARYSIGQQNSELFARFFQLFAEAKEISGYQSQYKYNIEDINKALINSAKWAEQTLGKLMQDKLDVNIVNLTKSYIKQIQNINHKWSEQKVQKLHGNNPDKKWTKAVKSMKDI